MKTGKRILSLLLILTMCLSLLPLSAFAEEDAWEDEVAAEEPEDLPEGPEEGEEDEEPAACTHVPDEAVIENEAAPGCTEPGSHDLVVYCAVCGAELSRETVEDPAVGHSWTDVEEVPAEPGRPGRTAGTVCAVCGELLSGCEEIDALPEEPAVFEADGLGELTADGTVLYSGYCGDPESNDGTDLSWTLTDEGVLTISGEGDLPDIGYPYYNAPWYEHRDLIQTLVIQSDTASIGDSSFIDCGSLTSVTLPASLTGIGLWAFKNCSSLQSIELPANLESIGNSAFTDCTALESVTIPAGVTSIGNSAFSGCTALTNVNISDLSAWCAISFQNAAANPLYNGAGLYLDDTLIENLVIPNDAASIGAYAFCGCTALTSVTIPASVTSIGVKAFQNCSNVAAVHISDLAAWCAISFGDNYSTLFDYTADLYLGDTLLTEIVIPETVESIGSFAFYKCENLTGVTISEGVTAIGTAAFRGCTSLEEVSIPTTVTSIGDEAFKLCSSLTEVQIPEGVETIGASAFYQCYDSFGGKGLQRVSIPSTLTSVGGSAFGSCLSLESVSISDLAAWCAISFEGYESTPLYHAGNLYLNGVLVEELEIPNTVTAIGDYAFEGCTSLTSAEIPSGVTSIGASAFYGCRSLESITVPATVQAIGNVAFRNCESLGSFVIPYGVTSIGSDTFKFCSSLQSVTIPATVESIGIDAFQGCTALTSVTIPASLESIDSSAFKGCTGLQSVSIPSGVETIGSYAFQNCTNLASVTIPASVTSIGSEAFRNCPALTSAGPTSSGCSIEFGWTEAIPDRAFDYCSDLESVTIPATVTSIGIYAFFECSDLKSITIPATVTSIGYCAFQGCSLERFTAVNISDLSAWCTIAFDRYNAHDINQLTSNPLHFAHNLYLNGTLVTELEIPSDVTAISDRAFTGSTCFTSLTIPSSVTSIGVSSFEDCSGLKEITIPATVTSVGQDAFSGCTGVTDVYFVGSQAQWDALLLKIGESPLSEAQLHLLEPAFVAVSEENFPDNAFRTYVSDVCDGDGDGLLSEAEIAAVTIIGVPELNIQSLVGIEYFTALQFLNCQNNQLTELDVSGLSRLTTLYCGYNGMTSFTADGCGSLVCLHCEENQLSGLDLTGLENLMQLWCWGNGLSSLDLRPTPGLCNAVELGRIESYGSYVCYYTQYDDLSLEPGVVLIRDIEPEPGSIRVDAENFPDAALRGYVSLKVDTDRSGYLNDSEIEAVRAIDVKNSGAASLQGIELFPNLTQLSCGYNELTALDLSANTALQVLLCEENRLTALDLTGLSDLRVLWCWGNGLSLLDLRPAPGLCSAAGSGHTESYGSYVSYFTQYEDLSVEPGVTLIQDAIRIDAEHFPDSVFRAYVSNNFDNGDGLLSKAEIAAVTDITVPDLHIQSLAGIEHFTALQVLNCQNNLLTELDVSGLSQLTTLYCGYNGMSSFTAAGCGSLVCLHCEENRLSTLELTGLENLMQLWCWGNGLSSLDLRPTPGLCNAVNSGYTESYGSYVCYYTRYDDDLSVEPGVMLIRDIEPEPDSVCVDAEHFPDAALRGYVFLKFDRDHNGYLSESEIEAVREIDVKNSGAASLQGIELFPNLTRLSCGYNTLTALDLSGNTALQVLCCEENWLTALDLTGLDDLRVLWCWGNDLNTLDLSAAPGLCDAVISGYAERYNGYTSYFTQFTDLSADDGVALLVGDDRTPLPASLTLDHSYLALAKRDSATLTLPGLSEDWAARVIWTSDNPDVASVENGVVTAGETAGYAWITASLKAGAKSLSASCRVDVLEGALSEDIDVWLLDPKATVELYSSDYTRLRVQISLEQNLGPDAFTPLPPEDDELPTDAGFAVVSARFSEEDPKNADLASLFKLRVVDDRTLEIVPTAKAFAEAAKLKGSYKATILVTVKGQEASFEAETALLTLTVKKTVPKVSVKAVKFNSFFEDTQELVFTGAVPEKIRVETAPDWLSCPTDPVNGETISVTYRHGDYADKKLSGKLTLFVQPAGWNLELPVTVSVSSAPTYPKLTLKPTSLTLKPNCGDEAEAAFSITPADLPSSRVEVSRITEGSGKTLQEYGNGDVLVCDVQRGKLTVRTASGFDDVKARSFKVYLSVAGRETASLTVKTSAASVKPTLTAKATGTIDTALYKSPVTVVVTPKNINAGAVEITEVRVWQEKKNTEPMEVTDWLQYTRTGPLSFTLTEFMPGFLQNGYTYTAEITTNVGAKATVKLPVKFSDASKLNPSVTLKVEGTIDPIRPGSKVTITPVLKNYYDYTPHYEHYTDFDPEYFDYDYLELQRDLIVWAQVNGKFVPIEEDENNPFDIRVVDGAFVLTQKPGVRLNPATDKFKVSLETTGRVGGFFDGRQVSLKSSSVALNVKMGTAKIDQSTKAVTLLFDDRFDRAVVQLTPETGLSGINWEKTLEAFVSPKDKSKRDAFALTPLDDNSVAIGYSCDENNEPLLPAAGFRGGSVKLNIFLQGNETGKPNATLSVNVQLV